jgi:hypothetical protein
MTHPSLLMTHPQLGPLVRLNLIYTGAEAEIEGKFEGPMFTLLSFRFSISPSRPWFYFKQFLFIWSLIITQKLIHGKIVEPK